jgi:hypothetical protein
MDADMQDSPDEIPGLYEMIRNRDSTLFRMEESPSRSSLSKNIPSKFFNWTTSRMSGVKLTTTIAD